MTFKEKLALEHPEEIDKESEGGCNGCPYEYGYGKRKEVLKNCLCYGGRGCEYCWNREMPNSEPTVESITPTPNATIHQSILDELHQLYIRKNHDYGDSFHTTFEEEGWAMVRIRLGDKFSRLKTLSKGEAQMVNDESLRDTLVDLANYAIMSVMEIDRSNK